MSSRRAVRLAATALLVVGMATLGTAGVATAAPAPATPPVAAEQAAAWHWVGHWQYLSDCQANGRAWGAMGYPWKCVADSPGYSLYVWDA